MRTFLELEVSRTCNLACTYCYMKPFLKPLDAPDRFVTIDEVLGFIEQYSNLPRIRRYGQISIELFGGEPFLNIPVCTYLLNDVHEYNGMPVGYSCVTNCTIFHKDYAEAIIRGTLNCEISIDDPVNHLKHRRTVKNKESYTLCLQTLARYSKYLPTESHHSMRLRSSAISLDDIPRIILHWAHLYHQFPACGSLFINLIQNELPKETKHYSFWVKVLVRAFSHLKPTPDSLICPHECYFCNRECMSSLVGVPKDHITVRRYNAGVSEDIVEVTFASTGDYIDKLKGQTKRDPKKNWVDFYIENCDLIAEDPQHANRVMDIVESIISKGPAAVMQNFEKFHLLDFVPRCSRRTELKKAIADVIDFYAKRLKKEHNIK